MPIHPDELDAMQRELNRLIVEEQHAKTRKAKAEADAAELSAESLRRSFAQVYGDKGPSS